MSWDNDESASIKIAPLPGAFNISEWNRFSLDAEFAVCRQRPDFWKRLESRVVRNAAAEASAQLDPALRKTAAERAIVGPGHLASLHQADSRSRNPHIMTSNRPPTITVSFSIPENARDRAQGPWHQLSD